MSGQGKTAAPAPVTKPDVAPVPVPRCPECGAAWSTIHDLYSCDRSLVK